MQELFSEYANAYFLSPERFWLSIPILITLSAALIFSQRTFGTIFLRLLSLSLLVLAFAEPVSEKITTSRTLPVLVDLSESVNKDARIAMLKSLKRYLTDPQQSLELYPFAKEVINKPINISPDFDPQATNKQLEKAAANLDRGETRIGDAIKKISAGQPQSSVLLLSDGFDTQEQIDRGAVATSDGGLKVYAIIPDEQLFISDKLSISTLAAQLTAHSGSKVELRASLRNQQQDEAEALFELWLEKEKLFSAPVTIPPFQEKLFIAQTPSLKGGLQRIKAILRAKDKNSDQSLAEKHRWLSVKEKEKILLLSGSSEDSQVIKRLLQSKGYSVEDIIADGNQEIPTQFTNFRGIILNNTARRQLPANLLTQLKSYVEKGGGLLLLGGERSFGLGGYIETPLEEIAPVKFLPPRSEKKRLIAAVALVIDKSGSMGQENKMIAAQKAALLSINALKDDDWITVIGFDNAPFVVIDIKKAVEAKEQAERRLRNLYPQGQTNPLAALAAARQKLRNTDASRKHIIVLSDGKFPLASDAYVEEINRLRADGITVSAVALGIEADVPFMKLLSKYGKGSFYHTLNPQHLPQVFLEDINASIGEKTMAEDQYFAVGKGPGGLSSTTVAHYPPLLGFIETLPKVGSTLELITKRSDQIFPILASWKHGAGTVIAFTSDANGRWSQPWLRWPDFTKFWAEIIEKIKETKTAEINDVDFDLRYQLQGKSLYLDLAVFDETLSNRPPPAISAEVIQPGGESRKVGFHPVQKGRFQAIVENARPGDYRIGTAYGNLKFPQLGVTLSGDEFGEISGRGLNVQSLEEITHRSGGAINPAPGELQAVETVKQERKQLFPPLLLLAIFLIILEAILRENRGLFSILNIFRRRSSQKRKGQPVGHYHKTRKGGKR